MKVHKNIDPNEKSKTNKPHISFCVIILLRSYRILRQIFEWSLNVLIGLNVSEQNLKNTGTGKRLESERIFQVAKWVNKSDKYSTAFTRVLMGFRKV